MTIVNSIGPHIGKEIPVNEDLERFIDTVDQLETLDRENMHIALSGVLLHGVYELSV